MSHDNTGIIRGVYEAFARGDIPAVLGALDANVEWQEAEGFLYADQNPYVGPESCVIFEDADKRSKYSVS